MCITTRYAILIHFCIVCRTLTAARVSFWLENRMHNGYTFMHKYKRTHTHTHRHTSQSQPTLTYTLMICFIVVAATDMMLLLVVLMTAVIVVVILLLLLLRLPLVCRHRFFILQNINYFIFFQFI